VGLPPSVEDNIVQYIYAIRLLSLSFSVSSVDAIGMHRQRLAASKLKASCCHHACRRHGSLVNGGGGGRQVVSIK
jgi:hypothetical protein